MCIFPAKSYAVLCGGSKKQSGSILPYWSSSFPIPPGNTAMYLSSSSIAVLVACWTPVLPYFVSTFFCMNSSAFFCFSFMFPVIVNVVSPGT